MVLQLRPDVHAAVIDEHLVLLDVGGDGYLCLPGGAAVLEGGAQSGLLASGPLARHLLEAGLARDAGASKSRASLPAKPGQTVIHQSANSRLTPRVLIAALSARRDVERAGRRSGLKPYLDLALSARPLESDPAAVRAAARLFWDILPWLRVRGECLQRSAALVSFLRRLNLRADWVFGVRLWPFAAHCWVQHADICLNDDFERLEAFTPILRR